MAVFNCSYYSQARVGQRNFTAIVPVEKMPEFWGKVTYQGGPFPTLYLLHGFSGNQNDWLLNSRIHEWAMARNLAVIMPDGANDFYVDRPENGEFPGAQVGEELVEVTRNLFPLSHKKEDTAVGGLSMGGFGALRLGLRYPETFGWICALSSGLILDEVSKMTPGHGNAVAPYGFYRTVFGEPSRLLGSDKDPYALAQAAVKLAAPPKLFLAIGTEDPLYQFNLAFHNYLNEIGYGHEWYTHAGQHNFDFWNDALPAFFAWQDKMK
jgi:S-formylglutathione hydrolase FrmB